MLRTASRMVVLPISIAVLGVSWSGGQSTHTKVGAAPPAAPAAVHVPNQTAARAPELPAHVRYIAIGGGAGPSSTEVSLEQNLVLATTVLPGPGFTLFGGGSDAPCVRSADRSIDAAALSIRLGKLFAPHAGRTSRYREPELVAPPATLTRVERALSAALSDGDEPLLLYVGAHGEQGKTPRDNQLVLWGREGLAVSRLAELHDAHSRPLRVVIATCYSGGFAELAFKGATASRGITEAPRCGLFSSQWDRQASGCDPDPERRLQENYSLHLLHALRREDRDGKPLPKRDVDFDGDGTITLLEAHARARIASASIDVPTTTSERFLREQSLRGSAIDASLLPEDAAVIDQIGKRLGLPTLDAARARAKEIGKALNDLDDKLDQHEAELKARRIALITELLSRWPVIDDPYHRDYRALLDRDELAILQALEHGTAGKAFWSMKARTDKLDARYADMETREAAVLRLVRAYETLQLATALAKCGGAAYEGYRRLLACERAPL